MSSSVYQMPLPNWDPLRRLGEVERALRQIFPDSAPCRATLIAMCDDGTLDAIQDSRNGYYYVYESSLTSYIRALQQPRQHKLAA
jgi:hypothetical protein